MNINDVFVLTLTIVNKNQGAWSIPRFNSAIASASWQFFNDCFGQPVLEKNGQAVNNLTYQSGEKLSNNLRQLITPPMILQVNAQGTAIRPTDFVQTSSMRYQYGSKQVEVKFVRDNNLSQYLDSDLLSPDKQYPIYCIYSSYFQFYPKDMLRVIFTYLRKPATPVWNFTIVNGRPVYNPVTSVDVEFPDECLNEIVTRVVALFGINIREKELQQYAQNMKNQGS